MESIKGGGQMKKPLISFMVGTTTGLICFSFVPFLTEFSWSDVVVFSFAMGVGSALGELAGGLIRRGDE